MWRKIPIMLTAAFVFTVSNLSAIEPYQRILWGSSRTCFPTEDYLYVGAGGAVLICEITNEELISVINYFYLPTEVQDIIVDGNTLYALDLIEGLIIFNVENASTPIQMSALDLNLYSYTLTLDSNFLFVTHEEEGLTKIDVSNPEFPFISEFSDSPSSILTKYSGYLYSTYNQRPFGDYITVFDPTSLDSISIFTVGQSYPYHETLEMQFYNNHAYLIENYYGIRDPWSELSVLDMADPLNPTRISTVDIEDYGNSASAFLSKNDTLIVSFSDDFNVYDLSDPLNPILISENSNVLESHMVEYLMQNNSYLFAGHDYAAGINLVKFTDSSTCVLLDYLDTSCHIGHTVIDDSLLITGKSGYSGMFFIDISDILNPLVSQVQPENLGRSITFLREDNYLYAGDDTGFSTYLVSGGDSLTFLSRLEIGQYQNSKTIGKKDSIVYLGSHSRGIKLINVSNPEIPALVNVIDPGGYIRDLFIRGNRLFFCGYAMPTMIWDVSDVMNPSLLIGDFNNGLYGEYLFPSENGSILYLAHNRELAIVDVANLDQIDTISTIDISTYNISTYMINDIFVEEERLLISTYSWINDYDAEGQLYAFDISDLSNPQLVDKLITVGVVRSITSDSNYYYVSNSSNGIYVVDKDQITSLKSDGIHNNMNQTFILTNVYPNPFNSVTTIQYELPQRSDVQITIYDLLGRQVTTLLSEIQEAGYKSVQWDATNIPSGMYFYQIRAGKFVQTRKMVLLK